MAKQAPSRTEPPETAAPPKPRDHTSDMVVAQRRAAEEHRSKAARMAAFRQSRQSDGHA